MEKRLKYLNRRGCAVCSLALVRTFLLLIGCSEDKFSFLLVDRQLIRIQRVWKVPNTDFERISFIITREQRLGEGRDSSSLIREMECDVRWPCFPSVPMNYPLPVAHRNSDQLQRSRHRLWHPFSNQHWACDAIFELVCYTGSHATSILVRLTEQEICLGIVLFDHFCLIVECIMNLLSFWE